MTYLLGSAMCSISTTSGIDLRTDRGVVGISASAARTHASRGIATLRERLSTEEGW